MVRPSLDWACLAKFVSFARLGSFDIHLFYVWRMAGIDSTGYTRCFAGFQSEKSVCGSGANIDIFAFFYLSAAPSLVQGRPVAG